MTDKNNKEILQNKLFEMSEDQDKIKKNIYEAIGILAISYDVNKDKIESQKQTLQFFDGVKNGLSKACNQVGLLIPDKEKTDELARLGLQLANWVHNSGFTKEEFKELKILADKIIKVS
jgi:hypothetical protein